MSARSERQRKRARLLALAGAALLLAESPCFFVPRGWDAGEACTLVPGEVVAFPPVPRGEGPCTLWFECGPEAAQGELCVRVGVGDGARELVLPLGGEGVHLAPIPSGAMTILRTPGAAALAGRFVWQSHDQWLGAALSRQAALFGAKLAVLLFGVALFLRRRARGEERTARVEAPDADAPSA